MWSVINTWPPVGLEPRCLLFYLVLWAYTPDFASGRPRLGAGTSFSSRIFIEFVIDHPSCPPGTEHVCEMCLIHMIVIKSFSTVVYNGNWHKINSKQMCVPLCVRDDIQSMSQFKVNFHGANSKPIYIMTHGRSPILNLGPCVSVFGMCIAIKYKTNH